MSKITKLGKQAVILGHLNTVEQATIQEIYDNVTFGYEAYRKQHIDTAIDELVRRKAIVRLKAGVYATPKEKEPVEQIGMF